MRIERRRFVRGWRTAELENFYDVACWSEQPMWRDRVRNRGGTVGVDPICVNDKIAKARAARELYAAQAEVRQASKDRVYAWRRRQRAEREERRQVAREAHASAISVADAASGELTAYANVDRELRVAA